MSDKHTIYDAERMGSGYARFVCPEVPLIKLVVYKVVLKCPICGQHFPLDERRSVST